MQRSESITELTKALVAAQGEFKPAIKSKTNPLLHSKYATLDNVIEAVRDALKAHGLCFVQPLSNGDEGNPLLETIIIHESGESFSTSAHIPAMAGNKGVNDLQAFGSALTYMRRYMLASMLGISSEEDSDGGRPKAKTVVAKATEPIETTRKQPVTAPVTKPQEPKKSNAPHWIEDDETRKNFWGSTGKLTLTHEQVHTALGVTSLKEYTGTQGEAKTAITKWTADQVPA